MRKWLLLIPACLLFAVTLPAQRENTFTKQLWYGGGFNFGISGATGQSAFLLGVSPMVGYKIAGPFSIGPRVAVNYTHFRVRLPNNEVATANPISWALGVFGRAKVSRNFFAHAEYELAEDAFISNVSLANGIEIWRRQHGNTYIGAGYNSGNTWGSEILFLYNLTPPLNELAPPFNIRIGFTYRF